MSYARTTTVDRSGSVAELDRLVTRYGADGFAYGREGDAGWVGFRLGGRAVRLTVPMPDKAAGEFVATPTGKPRAESAALSAWEQACRARWRAVVLIVKAKLEAIESGISSVEREFLPDIVLPGGQTVGDQVIPSVIASLETGRAVRLLPEPSP